MKNKRGFTIVEVVIALTEVIIISIGTISLMQASTKSLRRATYNVQAQNFVADVVSCYRVGELSENFENNDAVLKSKQCIAFAGGTSVEKSDKGFVCVLPNSGYVANIIINGNTMTVRVLSPSETSLVAEASFTKGGTSQL